MYPFGYVIQLEQLFFKTAFELPVSVTYVCKKSLFPQNSVKKVRIWTFPAPYQGRIQNSNKRLIWSLFAKIVESRSLFFTKRSILNVWQGFKYASEYFNAFISNPFVRSAPFLYPLKTSENCQIFWCFQGEEKGCIRNEWINVETYWQILSDDYNGITENMEHVNSMLGAICAVQVKVK